MTQAMVKNGFLLYSDSLLLPAIEYYSTDEESPELMKTLFYQSEIEMNRFDSIYMNISRIPVILPMIILQNRQYFQRRRMICL